MPPYSIINPITALLAGILILFFPAIINYIIAFYLITFGILGLMIKNRF